MEGWVKLYRKFLQWEWSNVPEMVTMFVHLLLMANPTDTTWRSICVKKGQLITTVASLRTITGLSTKQVRTCLERLIKTNEVTVKTTNKFSIITICNYETYQVVNIKKGKQEGKQEAGETAIDKEDKNKGIINPPTPLKRFGKIDFIDEGFVAVVEKWLGYKKAEFKDEYKTIDSLKMWYNKLYKMAGGDSVVAEMIVNQSIENHWKGIFEVKGSGLPVSTSINTGNGKLSPKEALRRMVKNMNNNGVQTIMEL